MLTIASSMVEAHRQTPRTLPLTDLPSPWLQQLPGELDRDALLALFRTCRAMRDLALSQRKVRLQFDLPILAARAPGAKASLLLACNQAPSVSLVLKSTLGDANQPPGQVDASTSACTLLMSSAMAAASRELAAIKSVELQGLTLDALVASWLTYTCPHMTSLQLRACQFSQLPDPSTSIPTCGQLQQLQLLCAPDVTDDAILLRWQHQLRALTGLQSLTLGRADDGDGPGARWLQCSAAIGGQLTQLSLAFSEQVALPVEFAAWFPCIRELHLTHMVLGDEHMEVLLSMPSIRHIQCKGFQLQHSYAQRPCSWTRLGVADFQVNSFALLPLAGIQFLYITSPPGATLYAHVVYFEGNLEVTRQAVAAITQCGGIQWGATRALGLCLHGGEDNACLVAFMPLLSTCQARVVMFAAPVTFELLAAIKQHLASAWGLAVLELRSGTWPTGVCQLVLPSLPPHVNVLRLGKDIQDNSFMTESQLGALLVQACRPITVYIAGGLSTRFQSGWEQRVRDTMKELMTQQYVTLVVE